MASWKLLKFLSHATDTRISVCTARNRLRGARLIFELWNLNFNIDHFVYFWWRKWVYFQNVLMKMFTFVRHYMNFILSKVFVNIKTVLQNYCTQCLFWLNFLFWVYNDKCGVWETLNFHAWVQGSSSLSRFPRGGGGGGTLIFSHIRRLGPLFGVQNSEFQYFFGFSEKWIFLGGMKILWIFFWGHHKIWLVWGSFLCNLGSFFKVNVQNWDIFLGC